MAIITIRTGEILEEVQKAMLKRMAEMFKMVGMGVMPPGGKWVPPTDVYETEQEFIILVDAAGVHRETLDITLHKDLIRISGMREGWNDEGKKQFHQVEIPNGCFERILQLPSMVESDGAQAIYNNGLLRITLKKMLGKKTYHVEVR